MTERRMTTLISKVPLRRWLTAQLQERGLQFSAADLAALIENVSPKVSQSVLSYALDFIRPHTLGMGLKIARLSDTQVEVTIPFRTRNLTENHEIDESVCTAAAIEGARCLWLRHAPIGQLSFSVVEMRFKKFRPLHGPCRARMELSEVTREKVLVDLRRRQFSECTNSISLFDDKDQNVAEISARLELKWTPALNSTKD